MFHHISFNSESLGNSQQRSRILWNLVETFANPQLNFSDSNLAVGDTFSFLIEKFARAEGRRGGEYYTPQSLIPLMIDIAQPKSGMSVYDPAVGTGGMLVFANQWVKKREGKVKNIEVYGQDISHDAVFISRMNLLLHQVFDASIFWGDTLLQPKLLKTETCRNLT
jgi:type I restriction enzyme M protein